jgi:transcriptional regulator with XRE-family HTH domain
MVRASDVRVPSLALVRASQGLTQKQLFEKTGVAKSTIVRAEHGGTISILTATKLAQALGVSVADLKREAE